MFQIRKRSGIFALILHILFMYEIFQILLIKIQPSFFEVHVIVLLKQILDLWVRSYFSLRNFTGGFTFM